MKVKMRLREIEGIKSGSAVARAIAHHLALGLWPLLARVRTHARTHKHTHAHAHAHKQLYTDLVGSALVVEGGLGRQRWLLRLARGLRAAAADTFRSAVRVVNARYAADA